MAIPRNLANLANQLNSDGEVPKIEVGDSSVAITDTGSNGTITLTTDNSERMRVDAAGRLLVGTNTTLDQNAQLQVAGTGYYVFNGFQFSNDAFATTLSLKKSRGATVGTNTIVQSGDTIGTVSFFGANGTGYTPAALINAVIDGTPGASNDMPGRLIFSTTADGSGTPTERMRITSGGNVLIATTNAIDGITGAQLTASNTSENPAYINIFRDDTSITSGQYLGYLQFCGRDTTSNLGIAHAYVAAVAEAEHGTADNATALTFGTTPDNSATISERVRITSGGYFKASNSGAYGDSTGSFHELYQTATGTNCANFRSSSGSYTATVIGIQCDRDTTNGSYNFLTCSTPGVETKLVIADSGNVTNKNGSYGTISDIKLKQDIVDASSQWDDIKNLRFRKYRFKSDVEVNPDAKPLLGLVAQEAELVSPGLIEEQKDIKEEVKTREIQKTREVTPAVLDKEGNIVESAVTETYTETEEYTETIDLGTTTKAIKTSVLYMKAVKALQEAITRIETLEAEVAALKAK